MALAYCGLSPRFPPSSHNSVITRKTIASLSSPSLPKSTKRKNHLRSKLLKTFRKPNPTTPLNPQQNPETHKEGLELPQEKELETNSAQNLNEIPSSIELEGENDESKELSLQNPQVSAIPEAENVVTTRSVFELVFYIVGLFIVQTIITVWVLRSNDTEKSIENEEERAKLGLEMLNGKKKEGFWFSRSKEVKPDNIINVDESQLEGKIVEIRAMAKEVRRREARKSSNDSDEFGVDEDVSVVTKVNTNIQEEVDGKLGKLDRKLRSLREKPLTSKISYLNNPDEGKNKKKLEHSRAKVEDENLMFTKKLKFRNAPSKPTHSPRGFQSDKNYSGVNGNNKTSASQNTAYRTGTDGTTGSSLANSLNSLEKSMSKLGSKEEETDSSSEPLASTQEIITKTEKQKNRSKGGEGMKKEKNQPRSGHVRGSSNELLEPKDSTKLKTKSSPLLKRHDGQKQMVNNSKDKGASIENDTWWLNLPYVLAILMQRSSENEGPGGLYSLKMADGSPSHLVAFEDHRDASNFCHILEAFFNELGDLSADVIPLSIKELKDELEANALKIIVVRKGKLQLYVGQPLADVEMTLRSFVS